MSDFKEINITELTASPYNLFNKDWALLTAGNSEKFNTMTVSWGGVGILWNKNVATVYVRKSRYTLEFIDKFDHFSLTFGANVWEPKAGQDGGKEKYSVSLIIPKSDTVTIQKIKAAIQAAYEEGAGKLKGNGKSVPALAAIKTPLRDGDIERPDDEAYANAYFVNANSITAPEIVDADRQPILTHSEVYSGVYGRASINVPCNKKAL